MKRDYHALPEFELLRPIVMPMTRLGIWFANRGLDLTWFLVPTDHNVRISRFFIRLRDRGRLKMTVFTPKNLKDPLPALVYFPGGGFMMSAAFAHKRNAAKMAAQVGCKVILAHYRLAPRHPFPSGLLDCEEAFDYVLAHAAELGVDPNRIAMGGDSAGGTLTAGVTLLQRDENEPRPCFAMLLYPALENGNADFESRKKYVDTPMFNTARFHFIEKHYYRNGFQHMEKYAFPLRIKDYSGLPPYYIETAEFDCLHDDGVIAARRMREHGVPVELVETLGTYHGYDAVELSPVTKECVRRRVGALRKAFGLPPLTDR
ncbi:MAG TPA: alpha/beta hydrolase [Candidatus Izemoplasmatales bacterium]|nr:alpha/beta hydrolase [Candidatus Izemoplasmatales bacterium]